MPPNDMSFQPFQKKTSSKFPPPKKKNSKNMCVPTYFPVPFPTQKTSKKNPKKLSRPWCLREVSCWKPSKIWMMIPWNPKRCLAVNIWIWKKKRRWIFWFLSWIQSRYSYWKSEGSFTFYALFGDFLLTPPQNWGEMMNVFQMGWRNEARVFL